MRATLLRSLFAAKEDPYAGADLGNAKRLGSVLWLIGAAIAAVLLPFAPPTVAIGDAGWGVAVAIVASSLVWAGYSRRPGTGFRQLLLASYVAVIELAVLQWLAGGDPAYEPLYLLSFVFCAAVHPPRRAGICIGVGSIIFLAPLTYDVFTYGGLVSHLTRLLIWWGISFVTMVMMAGVRAQRLAGQEASREARVDSLTGLGNRRAFEEAVEREMARARRSGGSLSLLMADLDDFKSINDEFGHTVGDGCLQKVADALRLTVRVQDLCFRWGGDEFVALLPETGIRGAEQVRARLMATVRAACLGPDQSPLSVCAGVAEFDEVTSVESFVASADMDLLLAKRGAQVAG